MTERIHIVGLDVDDVLCDFFNVLNERYNRIHGTNFRREDYKTYNLWDTWQCKMEEAMGEVYDLMTESEGRLPVVRGAADAVEKLSWKYHSVALTSRSYGLESITRQWLRDNFYGMVCGVYFGNHFGGNNLPAVKKSELAWRAGAQLIVEDCLENAIDCAREGIKVLLLDCPWNQSAELPANVERVFSWEKH